MTEVQIDRLDILDEYLQKYIARERAGLAKKQVKSELDRELLKFFSLLAEYFTLEQIYEISLLQHIENLKSRIDWADKKANVYKKVLLQRGVDTQYLAAYTKKNEL